MIRQLLARFRGGGTTTRTRSTSTRGRTTSGGGIGARVGSAIERMVRRR